MLWCGGCFACVTHLSPTATLACRPRRALQRASLLGCAHCIASQRSMSAKAAARKASKRARKEQEVVMDPACAAGTAVRRGPPVAPTSGLLSGSLVNDEWQTVRRSWFDLHANPTTALSYACTAT